MPGQPPGPLVRGVLRVLAEHGELTRAEMCHHLGMSRFLISSVVSRLNRKCKTVPKRIYIKRWVHEDDTTTRLYPKSVYAIGDLPDAKKPKPRSAKENSRKWRENERNRVNSVFMWAQPRKVRHAIRRGENP
jgi:hypothetical protein